MAQLLLGIDIGTSSSKGVLVRPDGTVVATAVREHALSTPRPGWAEHDAETVWWDDFVAISRELTGGAEEPIAAVGVSGIGPCFLATDEAGTPLRPAILYGVDTRATAEIAELTAKYGDGHILERCGSRLTTQAVGPKILWLQRNEPDVWSRTRRMFMASSLIVHRLTGSYVLDHHSASQCTPMYDPVSHTWITDWTDEIAPGLELPELRWPGDVAGTVTAAGSAATGLPEGIPVIAGTIDAWAEAVSAGVTQPGDLMLMYGTTMFFVQVLAERRTHGAMWGTVGVVPDTYNLAGGMATSGAVTDWLRKLTGEDYEQLVREAAEVGRGADGLLMLPYFAGERTPIFDPDARGVVIGMTLRHTRGHLYRAALEATAFGVRHNLEEMRVATAGEHRRESGERGAERARSRTEDDSYQRLVGVGGGTKGGLWTQIVTDVVQEPHEMPRLTVGACYGDAFLAAQAIRLADDPRRWNPIETVLQPDPEAAATYDNLYKVYRELYPATREAMHTLAAMQLGRV